MIDFSRQSQSVAYSQIADEGADTRDMEPRSIYSAQQARLVERLMSEDVSIVTAKLSGVELIMGGQGNLTGTRMTTVWTQDIFKF